MKLSWWSPTWQKIGHQYYPNRQTAGEFIEEDLLDEAGLRYLPEDCKHIIVMAFLDSADYNQPENKPASDNETTQPSEWSLAELIGASIAGLAWLFLPPL